MFLTTSFMQETNLTVMNPCVDYLMTSAGSRFKVNIQIATDY